MSDYNDTMTDTNGKNLNAHTPDVGTGWARSTGFSATYNILIQSNYAKNEFGNSVAYYLTDAPSSADYTIGCDCTSSASTGGPSGRISSTAVTMYLSWYTSSTPEWRQVKGVSGSYTVIATYSGDAPSTTRFVELILSGTSIKTDIDTVNRMSATDSAITATNYSGIYSLATQEQIDNWVMTNAGGGGGRIMGPLAGQGGLAGMGGLAGPGGGLAGAGAYAQRIWAMNKQLRSVA